MFDGLLTLLEDESASKRSAEINQEEENLLLDARMTREELWEAMYIQACYWSFGASIVDEARANFDDYMKKISGFMLVQDTPDKLATASELRNKKKKTKT